MRVRLSILMLPIAISGCSGGATSNTGGPTSATGFTSGATSGVASTTSSGSTAATSGGNASTSATATSGGSSAASSTSGVTTSNSGSTTTTGSTGGALYSLMNEMPATWYPYPGPGNLYNQRLPADVMSHLFQPQNYGISHFTGDEIAQAALTEDGQVPLNNIVSGGWVGWDSPASDGTLGREDQGRPLYYSAPTDPWYRIHDCYGTPDSGFDITIRAPSAALGTHLGPAGTADDCSLLIYDQQQDLWFGAGGGCLNYQLPVANGCGSTPETACDASNVFNYCSASELGMGKDWGNTGVITKTINGLTETYGDFCDNLEGTNSGSQGGYCFTSFSEQMGGIFHAMVGGISCTNTQGPGYVFPAQGAAQQCSAAEQLTHNGGNMPPNGSLIFVDYTDDQIAAMGLDVAQGVLLTALAHYGSYLQVTSGDQNLGFNAIVDGNESGLAYSQTYGAQNPFYSSLASQMLGATDGGPIGVPRMSLGSTDNTPPQSQYRLAVNATYGLPLMTGPGSSDLSGRSCATAPGCDVSGHIHIADPCVVEAMAGLDGGCP
jgi:hypothetical protein